MVPDALTREAVRERSSCLINSAATCRAVACLLTEQKEEEEEDPAGIFGLPAGFPVSPVGEGLNLCWFFTQQSTSLSVSLFLSVVEPCCKVRVGEKEREVELNFSGGSVVACANTFSLLPEGFIRLPTYRLGERGLKMEITSSLSSERLPPYFSSLWEGELFFSPFTESFTSAEEDKETKAKRERVVQCFAAWISLPRRCFSTYLRNRDSQSILCMSECPRRRCPNLLPMASCAFSLLFLFFSFSLLFSSFPFLFFSFSLLSLLDLESLGILLSLLAPLVCVTSVLRR
jgi:hypothetical protein